MQEGATDVQISLPVAPFFYGHCCRNVHRIPRCKAAKPQNAPRSIRDDAGTRDFSSVLLAAHVLRPDAGVLVVLIGIVIGLCSIGNTNHHATLAVGTVAVNAAGDG